MRQNKISEKAWKLLKEDERVALSLKFGYNKSTWQAGEVMDKAHYKFLEIEARAKFFLKMFTEHFELYDEIIPDYVPMDDRVKEYFRYVIGDRLKVKEAVDLIDNHGFNSRPIREELIIRDIKKLLASKKAIDNNFALLIFDFDRWNNFRVLPLSIQEPSAFKRRNKKNDQRNIKNLLSINEWSIKKIIERYFYTHNHPNTKLLYMPIPSEYLKGEEAIITVKFKDEVIDELSKVGFFLFPKHENAQEFYDLLAGYDFNKVKDCKLGQKFWPKYRQLIKQAINYNQINKRIASRKFLESALKDIDVNLLNPKNTDPNKATRKIRKNKGLGL